jgi:choline/glycine/proline betaine transport protein
VFEQKGLVLITQPTRPRQRQPEIGHGEEQPFIYQVQMRGYFTPSFARVGWVRRS